ncbi:magnesium transporter MgtE [Halalkaliarchaeum desulfuricum]|uniref:Magnesium transporter MgtE n=1 Tax=Halalkaliarchaeum desulfuricum TaxID=2055893 RepID=A0A343TJE1_9EURY|nr:magnesium transporter [Halalkaliarchaeum desulfuricum]AUX09213.1 magnesium transporter MgtE [Halalkaliarchaeum desulfuricum]
MTAELDQKHHDIVADVADDDYVAVEEDTFVGMAISQFREFAPTDEEEATIYYIYVTDEGGKLRGVLSFRELLNAPEDQEVGEIMETDVISLNAEADVELAARQMQELEYPALPIVDENNNLVGIARADDMVAVIEEEATEDMLKMTGLDFSDLEVSRSSAILESGVFRILRIRLPWLIVALAGGLMAGGVIGQYEAQLEAVVALAFFIPVIMDMGGNVGTQSSTIFVRGVALGHIEEQNVWAHVLKEGTVGAIIGVIVGGIAALAAFLWLGNADIALVVFISMVATCIIASEVGYLIPWVAHRIGWDPAAASDPVITTIKDISALIIYFSLAALLLAELQV